MSTRAPGSVFLVRCLSHSIRSWLKIEKRITDLQKKAGNRRELKPEVKWIATRTGHDLSKLQWKRLYCLYREVQKTKYGWETEIQREGEAERAKERGGGVGEKKKKGERKGEKERERRREAREQRETGEKLFFLILFRVDRDTSSFRLWRWKAEDLVPHGQNPTDSKMTKRVESKKIGGDVRKGRNHR